MSEPEPTRRLSFQQRARSLPHKYHYRVSVWWATLFCLLVLSILTAGVGFALNGTQFNAFLLIGLIFAAIPVWALGFLARKKASCPLCKGTPFLDSQASKHVKAVRVFPFNYGTTNLLRAFITRRFRCHFCGTPFDMLKTNLTLNREEPPYDE